MHTFAFIQHNVLDSMSDFVELNTLFNSFLFSMLLKSLLEYLLAIMITSVFSHSTFGLVHHVLLCFSAQSQRYRKGENVSCLGHLETI